MQDFLRAAKLLFLDLASTILFLVLYLLTSNILLSVALATALGLIQIAVPLIQRKPVNSLEWMSLFLVIAAGTATVLTDDPRIMLFKPSVIYVIVGAVMMRAGWMLRYLPSIAKAVSPDVAVTVGYAWSALMFVTAIVNGLVAVSVPVATWAMIMLVFGIVSKVVVFVAGFAAIRLTTMRRLRSMTAEKRAELLANASAFI